MVLSSFLFLNNTMRSCVAVVVWLLTKSLFSSLFFSFFFSFFLLFRSIFTEWLDRRMARSGNKPRGQPIQTSAYCRCWCMDNERPFHYWMSVSSCLT
ncbi:hypothetical protein V8C44DRAFT_314690 [Trichoderma aethiopicum]